MNLNIASIGVGIGAGLASALLLASIVSGSAFAFVLLWLSPLPLLIAGFGWGFGAALVGGVIASIALGSVTTYAFGLTFFLGIAGPSALLALVVMLARPAEESADPDVRAAGGYEWFPVGDIVEALAGMAAILGVLFVLQYGWSFETYLEALRPSVEGAIELMRRIGGPGASMPAAGSEAYQASVRFMAIVLPISLVSVVFLMLVLNTWIAGKIVVRSGRTARPWPDVAAFAMPRRALFVTLGATLLGLFTSGIVGVLLGIVATAFLIAYMFQGLAVMHYVTRNRPARGVLLTFIYLSILFLSVPGLVLVVLGLLDTLMAFRRRFPPPPAKPHPFA